MKAEGVKTGTRLIKMPSSNFMRPRPQNKSLGISLIVNEYGVTCLKYKDVRKRVKRIRMIAKN